MNRLRGAKSPGILRAGIDLVFAPECAWCRSDLLHPAELSLCDVCVQSLAPPSGPRCSRCGSLAPSIGNLEQRCPHCQGRNYSFSGVECLGSYEGELRRAVLKLKRPGEEPLARAMAEMLWASGKERLADFAPDVVAVVPMHWRRRLFRGVNSPELVAERLATGLSCSLAVGLLRRIRNTPPQADMPPAQRFTNMRGAFRTRRGHRLQGAHVLLVDDILTTGATCSEAAKVLRSLGAADVVVAVLARAEGVS